MGILDVPQYTKAEIDAANNMRVIPDMANSWWQRDDAIYDPLSRRIYIGGCSRGGAQEIGCVDLAQNVVSKVRLNNERFLSDDHLGVGLAFDFTLNRRPIAVFSPHDRSDELHVREADSYQTLDASGPDQLLGFDAGGTISYGSVIVKPSAASKRANSTTGSSEFLSVTSLNVATAHILVDGMRVRWSATAPTGFTVGPSYYVVNSSADVTKFALAATVGGAAIIATSTVADASLTLTDTGRGLVHARVNGSAVWAARSADLQVSVTARPTLTPPTFDDTTTERFRLINAAYVTVTGSGNTIWGIATSDPTPTTQTADVFTYFFKGAVTDSGALRNAAGALIGYLWGPPPAVGQPLIPTTGGGNVADLIYVASINDGVRWYDVARGGDAFACLRFDRRDFDVDDSGLPNQVGRNPENGGTYSVRRRKTSATTNDFLWEDIRSSGKPFGAYKSVYVGGMCFERDDALANALLAVVEVAGVWSVRRFTRTGVAYPTTTPGVWTEQAIIYTAPAGVKLGRPRIPVGAEGLASGQRICVVSEYQYYSTLNFTDWVSQQRVVIY